MHTDPCYYLKTFRYVLYLTIMEPLTKEQLKAKGQKFRDEEEIRRQQALQEWITKSTADVYQRVLETVEYSGRLKVTHKVTNHKVYDDIVMLLVKHLKQLFPDSRVTFDNDTFVTVDITIDWS